MAGSRSSADWRSSQPRSCNCHGISRSLTRRLTLIEERQARIASDIDGLVEETNRNIAVQKAAFAATDDELRLLGAEDRHLASRADASVSLHEQSARRLRALEATAQVALARLDEAKAIHRSTLLQTSALGDLVAEARQIGAARVASTDPARLKAIDEHAHDELYLAFENRFRGSPQEIAERCKRYIPLIRETPGVVARAAWCSISAAAAANG